MVLSDALDHCLQRDQACCGQDARLAHPPTEQLPEPERLFDELLITAKQ